MIDRTDLKKRAKAIYDRGGAVVPIWREGHTYGSNGQEKVATGKGPIIAGWQTRRLAWDELNRHLGKSEVVALGLVTGDLCTGRLANVAVLDFDGLGWSVALENVLHNWPELARTVGVRTGSGKRHKWVKLLNPPQKFTRKVFKRPDLDCAVELRFRRSNNVFYGLHPSGGVADWEDVERDLVEVDFVKLYDWLADWNNLCPKGYEYLDEGGKEQGHAHLSHWGKKKTKKRKGIFPPRGRNSRDDIIAFLNESEIEYTEIEKDEYTWIAPPDCLTGDHASNGGYGFQVFENGNALYVCQHNTCAKHNGRGAYDVMELMDLYAAAKKKPKTEEYITALAALGYLFRMNVCNDMVEVNKQPISDALRSKMRSQMRDLGYWRVNVMEDAWIANALDNGYHPIQEYLESLAWDGKDRIAELCTFFTDDKGLFPLFFRRWLIGAVARAYQSTQSRLFILDGVQGLGKSHFVRWLASPIERPEAYIEGPINPDDKDNLVRLITTWIWEVSELGSTFRKSDREALKYFLSLQQVTVRRPFGRYDLVKPALSSFIGTVNNEAGILDDPTGYRRFMAVHLERIDWSYTKLDPGLVWAQAHELYRAGETWHLEGEENKQAREANERYEVEDPLVDLLKEHFDITGMALDFTSTIDIQRVLHRHGWRLRSPRAESMAISVAAKKIDWMTKSKKDNPRGYDGVALRPEPVAKNDAT